MMKKFRYETFVALVVLMLAMLACGGGGNSGDNNEEATNAPATATPDPAANFTSYTSETSGVIVSYPPDWAMDDTFFLQLASDETLFSSTDANEGALMAFFSDTPANMGGSDPTTILTSMAADLTADGGMAMQGDPTPLTVKGQNGAIVDISGTADDGTPLTGFIAALVKADWATVVLAVTPTTGSENFLPTMRAVLNTVEVTSAPAPAEEPTLEPIVEPTAEPTAAPTTAPVVEPVATEDAGGGNAAAEPISQWATSAIASSEFSSSWGATNVIGAPDTPECGDYTTAWASSSSGGVDWIEVYYDTPVYATQINIYESYNPDQVVSVEVFDLDGNVTEVYTQSPEGFDLCPMVLSIDLAQTDTLIYGVRINVDQSVLSLGWNEIDAVELVGYPAN